MKKSNTNQDGQALITLLFFVIMSVTIATAAIVVLAINSLTAQKTQQGVVTFISAESAAEDGILRLIRDPDYSGGTISLDDGEVEIVVTGVSEKVITATSATGDFERSVVVDVDFVDNGYVPVDWGQIF